jgi:hypothetical protein
MGTSRLVGLGKILGLLVRASPWIVAVALIWEFREGIWEQVKDTLAGLGKGMGGAIPLGIGPAGIKVAPPKMELDKNKTKGALKTPVDDFTKMLNEIKKQIALDSKGIFNTKMFKDMGLDPAAINESINALINPQAGATTANQALADQKRLNADIVERTKGLMKQASDGLMNVYNEFKSANEQAFGSIFEPIEGEGEEAQLRKAWNWTGGATGLLNTMKARLKQFKSWRGSLNMLLKKGFSKEFVEDFKKMGREGMKHLDELKKAGPKRVKEFNAVFASGKAAVTKATEIDFDAQLKKWMAFGKNTAFKIAAGLESAEPGLERRMVAVVENVWGAVAKAIATQEVLIEEASRKAAEAATGVPGQDISKLKAKPEAKPVSGASVRAAGYKGKYAIPSAATGGLPVAAVQALGDRGKAMGDYWTQRMGPQMAMPNNYTFNVNGNFLTPKESMDAALQAAAHKTKNKR